MTKGNVTIADWLIVAGVLILALCLSCAFVASLARLTISVVSASGALLHFEPSFAMKQSAENALVEGAPKLAAEQSTADLSLPEEPQLSPALPPSQTAITVNAVGDCVLATGLGRPYANSFEYYINTLNKPYEYFFANVQEILLTGNLNIANSENAFTSHHVPRDKSSHGDRAFWFKSDPDYAKIYTVGNIHAVNVANNHTRDFGEKGFMDTIQALEDAGVQPFGFDCIAYIEVKGYTVALLGYSLVSRLLTEADMNAAARAVQEDLTLAAEVADLMIVSFHWGEEHVPEPSAYQESLARLTIDYGAHLVLGHHSHTLQRVDTYQGRLIAYSLGNFVYGGSLNPPRETIILQQTFFMDDELRLLDHSTHKIIEAETYGGSGSNNFQPVLVTYGATP